MSRNRNSDSSGQAFSEETIAAVWQKGKIVDGYHPDFWRYDCYGKPIKFSNYGHTHSRFGWEIDHIQPIAKGGDDRLENLQPLQWENNRDKGDHYPWLSGQEHAL